MRYDHKRIIVTSLIMATAWCFTLYLTDYPPESWAGVAAVGYIMMFGVAVIVSRVNTFALRKTYAYTVATFGERDTDESISDGQMWAAEIVSSGFVLAVVHISVGLSVMLTSLIIQAAGLPAIDSSLLNGSLVIAGVSLCFIVGFHALVHLAIYRAHRRRGRQIHPVTLARQYLRIGLRKIDKLFSVTRIPSEAQRA